MSKYALLVILFRPCKGAAPLIICFVFISFLLATSCALLLLAAKFGIRNLFP